MKPCPYCGALIGEDNNFCTSCGQRVAAAPAEPVFAAAPAAPVYEAAPAAPVYEEAPAAPAFEAAPAAPVYEEAPAAPAYQEMPQEPAPRQDQETEQDYGYSSNPFPTPTPAPKKKSKAKLVIWIIVAVLVIGIGVAAYFVATWYFSPEQEVLRLVEAKDYISAQTLVAQNMNLRYNKELENQVAARLEAIKNEFSQKTMDYATATAELDAIEKLELEGLKARIPEYRVFINNVNQSRADMSAAESLFAEGKYPEALESFRKVVKEDPDYSKATQRITDTINAYRTKILAEAAKEAEAGAFDSAVTVIDGGLVVLPDDAELLAQKTAYQQDHLNSLKTAALTEAEEAAEAKDYVKAMAVLDAFTTEHGEDLDVINKRNEYLEAYVDSVLAQVDDFQNQKDFIGAVKAIDDALVNAPDHQRLAERRTAVQSECMEYTLSEVSKLMEETKYEDALKLVNDALQVIPDDETLTDKKTEIEDIMGKWMVDVLTPYESTSYEAETFKMSGQDCLYGFFMRSGNYAMWNLGGEYRAISFDLGHVDGSNMSACTVSIYCDGTLKESFVVNPDALPQYYEISVEGVQQLKISIKDDAILTPYTGFANVKIYK